jgi:hypothetical protein
MSGKKTYTYTVPSKSTVVDINGIVRGAGYPALLHCKEDKKLVKENEDGDNQDTN